MATKTATSDAAHCLVRGLALRQRMLHSDPVSITHVAGSDNNLADFASRAITQLDDNYAFLTHFDDLFPSQERFWQRAIPPPRAAIQCAFDAALAALDAATVDNAVRATSWRWRQQYCTDCGTDPWLHDTTSAICSQLLLGFAARSCTGFFGKGRQVAQTVEKALRTRGTSLRAGRIPQPLTSRRRHRLGSALYPPP